jgi:hypothetical protein
MITVDQESQIIHLLVSQRIRIDANLSSKLASLGFTNQANEPFNERQINSILHSFRMKQREMQRIPHESCGIDRESNPCGDASDY